jgi:predicted enzyme related to lactoylglutathione lyase
VADALEERMARNEIGVVAVGGVLIIDPAWHVRAASSPAIQVNLSIYLGRLLIFHDDVELIISHLHHEHKRIFMILKTYTRIFTTDLESTVATLKAVHGTQPHLWLNYDPLTLVGIGDVLVIGGTDEVLEPIRGTFGPWIVEDIHDAKDKLLANGASIVRDIHNIPAGRMMYMKHADGSVVEYVQWARNGRAAHSRTAACRDASLANLIGKEAPCRFVLQRSAMDWTDASASPVLEAARPFPGRHCSSNSAAPCRSVTSA